MANELYLYSPIYDGIAEQVIAGLNASMGKEVTIRVNSPGGRVLSHWGMIAKMKEHGNVILQVDGAAMSAAANMVLYAKKVKALKVSKFMFHRADMFVETDQEKEFLNSVNTDLKTRMLARIDSSKLLAMKGVSIDRMFDMTQERIDVHLSADEMAQLGLIAKEDITDVDPTELTAFNEKLFKIAAMEVPPTPQPTSTTMTAAELKIKHPDVYNQIFAEGVEQEKDRVGAVMVYAHLDLEGAKKIIASGKRMTQTEQAEFGLKLMSARSMKELEAEAADEVTTDEVEQPVGKNAAKEAQAKAKAKELEDYRKAVLANMNIGHKADGAVITKRGTIALVTEN